MSPEQLKELWNYLGARETIQKLTALKLRAQGLTQAEAGVLVGLPQQTLSDWEQNVSNTEIGNAYIDKLPEPPDLRVSIPKAENTTSGSTNIELTREKQVALVRLILKGEKQEAIAEKFDVTQGYVSQVKTKFYDGALKAYRDKKLLKREVAERIGLQCEEIDQILGTFGDFLNFTPQAPLSCIPEPP